MTLSRVTSALSSALEGRRLLEHPFYRRWQAGELTVAELAAYAAQYRHFEGYLPRFLRALTERLDEGAARDFVAANLADEVGDPVSHVERFEDFAAAVGAEGDQPSPATTALVATYEALLERGPAAALAGFLAYEGQSAEIAASKADGLRGHYGLTDTGVSFWDHHAEVEGDHAEWARQALASLGAGAQWTEDDMRAAADAWWAFLDERQASSLQPA